MNPEIQEILTVLRALAEQSQLHDRQIDQNTTNLQILTQVVADQGEYFRGVAQNVDRLAGTVETIAEEVQTIAEEVRTVVQRMDIMHSEIRGLQTENRRILDILQGRDEQPE